MCRPASFIVLRDKVAWSKYTDCHEDIISEHGIHMDGVKGPNGVRVEISPNEGDLSSDIITWRFVVDQDRLPPWWDRDDAEKRVRLELKKWQKQKMLWNSNMAIVPCPVNRTRQRQVVLIAT